MEEVKIVKAPPTLSFFSKRKLKLVFPPVDVNPEVPGWGTQGASVPFEEKLIHLLCCPCWRNPELPGQWRLCVTEVVPAQGREA